MGSPAWVDQSVGTLHTLDPTSVPVSLCRCQRHAQRIACRQARRPALRAGRGGSYPRSRSSGRSPYCAGDTGEAPRRLSRKQVPSPSPGSPVVHLCPFSHAVHQPAVGAAARSGGHGVRGCVRRLAPGRTRRRRRGVQQPARRRSVRFGRRGRAEAGRGLATDRTPRARWRSAASCRSVARYLLMRQSPRRSR